MGFLIVPIAAPPVGQESSLVVSSYIWVNDDGGTLHGFGVLGGIWDEVTGVTPPTQISSFDGTVIGSALDIYGDDGLLHTFQLSGPESEWKDVSQASVPAGPRISVADLLLPKGLFIQSVVDGLTHKMGVIGGKWTDTGVPQAPGGGGRGGGPIQT